MVKTTRCKTCGAEINVRDKTCPYCGAKNHAPLMMKSPVIGMILVVLTLLVCVVPIYFLFFKEDNTKKQETFTLEDRTEKQEIYGVGDLVEFNDVSAELVSVTASEGTEYVSPDDGKVFVICEFEIENNSSLDIALSEIFFSEFNAYIDDYAVKYSIYAPLASDKQPLGGKIAAGKKMNGIVGYDAPADWSEIEIRFTPDFWTNKEAVFVAAKDEAEVLDSQSSQASSNGENLIFGAGTYLVGEDIPAGKYDCTAVSGFGVFRGDVASLAPEGLALTMGNSTVDVGESSATVNAAESYSNLQLSDGDTIYIEMSLSVEFIGQ